MLRANGLLVVDGWEEAYARRFSGAGGSKGNRPIVVSYATSPAAEVIFADAATRQTPRPRSSPRAASGRSSSPACSPARRTSRVPHALIDFMLSERFQAALPASMFVLPVRAGTPLPDAFRRYAVSPPAPLELPAVADRREPRPLDRRVDADRSPVTRAWRIAAVLVPAAFVALFFAYPLVAILERGLTSGDGLVASRRAPRALLWFTIWQAAVSTLLTLAAGLPLAWAIGRFRFRGRSLARALVLVPFVLPTVVVAAAFLAVLPDDYEGGIWAILAAHVFFNVAVVTRIVGGAWATIDPVSGEAATVLGAGPWRRRAGGDPAPAGPGPLGLRGADVPLLLHVVRRHPHPRRPGEGAPSRRRSTTGRRGSSTSQAAAVLSLLQLGAVAIVLAVASILEGRVGVAGTLTGEHDVLRRPTRRERIALVHGAGRRGRCARAAPRRARRTVVRRAGRALFRETPALLVEPWQTAGYSIAFAGVATLIALVVGGLAAVALARRPPGALDGFVLLPLGASAVMLGFGFVIAFDSPPLEFRSSWWLVPVAQALVATPFVIRIVTPALRSIDPRLSELAATLGASPSRAWREVDLPLGRRRGRGRSRIRIRDFAGRVRRHRVRRPGRAADAPRGDLPLPRATGRAEPGDCGRPRRRPGGDRSRRGSHRRARCRRAGQSSVMLSVSDARVTLGGHAALAGVDLDVAARHGDGGARSERKREVDAAARSRRAPAARRGNDRARRTIARGHSDRTGVGSASCSRTTRSSRIVTSPQTSASACEMQSVRAARTIEARVAELLELVGLEGREHRAIRSLSGGERKRVALARALAPAPRVLLLDEPLGALDRPLHDRLLAELGELFRAIGQTAVYVTHDVAEAFAIAGLIAVMREGRVVQVAAPEEIWAAPGDAWVARFIGLTNVEEHGATAVITRPEGVVLRPDLGGDAVVESSRRDGPLVTLHARYDSGAEIVSAHAGTEQPAPGDRVRVEIDPAAVSVVPTESQPGRPAPGIGPT